MKKNLHIIIISVLFSIILWGSISLSNDYYAIVNLPIKLVDFPSGYATGSPLPDQISIKLKGKGWKLIGVNLSSESDFVVPVGRTTGKRNISLYNYRAENQWLSSDVEVIDINPDTVSFFVEKVQNKELPITSNLAFDFKAGYGLASPIEIKPDSTEVYGPGSYLKKLNVIPTEDLKFSNLDDKVVKQVPLKNIQGMTYTNSIVTIYLDVQKIVDKNIDNLPVQVVDVPKDRDVLLLPNKISIAIRGGIDLIGKMSTDQFKAHVNYRDVVIDTLGSVVPQIVLPPNTTLLYTKPERLRYIIKKFN